MWNQTYNKGHTYCRKNLRVFTLTPVERLDLLTLHTSVFQNLNGMQIHTNGENEKRNSSSHNLLPKKYVKNSILMLKEHYIINPTFHLFIFSLETTKKVSKESIFSCHRTLILVSETLWGHLLCEIRWDIPGLSLSPT